MRAILDEFERCTASGGTGRPLTWFKGITESTPVQDLGDEAWSGESLLGAGSGADHTIFTGTRIGNVIVYTQMYSRAGEILDLGVSV